MPLERQIVHITVVRVTDDEWLWELRNNAGELVLNTATARPLRWCETRYQAFDEAAAHAKSLISTNRLNS